MLYLNVINFSSYNAINHQTLQNKTVVITSLVLWQHCVVYKLYIAKCLNYTHLISIEAWEPWLTISMIGQVSCNLKKFKKVAKEPAALWLKNDSKVLDTGYSSGVRCQWYRQNWQRWTNQNILATCHVLSLKSIIFIFTLTYWVKVTVLTYFWAFRPNILKKNLCRQNTIINRTVHMQKPSCDLAMIWLCRQDLRTNIVIYINYIQ